MIDDNVFAPLFSGLKSEKMWEAINKVDSEDAKTALAIVCKRMQEVEDKIIQVAQHVRNDADTFKRELESHEPDPESLCQKVLSKIKD